MYIDVSRHLVPHTTRALRALVDYRTKWLVTSIYNSYSSLNLYFYIVVREKYISIIRKQNKVQYILYTWHVIYIQ